MSLEDVVGDALFEEAHENMVLVRDIEPYSLCEHSRSSQRSGRGDPMCVPVHAGASLAGKLSSDASSTLSSASGARAVAPGWRLSVRLIPATPRADGSGDAPPRSPARPLSSCML